MRKFAKILFFSKSIRKDFADDVLRRCMDDSVTLITYYAYSADETPELATFMTNVMNDNAYGMQISVTDYVVVTHDKPKFAQKYIANNIVDATGKDAKQVANDIKWILSGFSKSECNCVKHKVFFYSDPHYAHKNIIKYCNRQWNDGKDGNGEIIVTDSNVQEMNASLVSRYNEVVSNDDTVYFLGDVSFGKQENVKEFISQLNGKKLLIKGNHDRYSNDVYIGAGFSWVYDRPILVKDFIILSHAPLQFLNSNCPFYNVYGHVHDSDMYQTWTRCSCCACVERHGYKPVSLDEVMRHYDKLNQTGCHEQM